MAYSPADPAQIVARLAGDSTQYTSLVGLNGSELYQVYRPPIVEHDRTISVAASATNQRVFAWMLRGNRDLLQVRVRVYATGTGGTSTLTALVGGTSGTASPAGAGAWYTINITPPMRGPIACELQATTPLGVTVDIERIQVYLVMAAPGSGVLRSGFVQSAASWLVSGQPVPTEYIERLLSQPSRIARDRPACVAMHLSELSSSGGAKDVGNWHSNSTSNWETVGRLRVPRCDLRTRSYWIDAYTLESSSGGQALIAIGNTTLEIANMGGTTGRWTSKRVSLGVGPHDIRASIKPGGANSARIAALQVWRGVILDAA